ncbi:MAG: MBL fold metallo-hydrolase [Clostridia bacterium]|nr:MBL fold metallo-hydrolase [Deltaproteobacteria bacterium]
MFEITFLGTAASTPSIDRGLSSLIVRAGKFRFLVDCGEGTQRQLLKSGVGYRKLSHVLLTHAHLDHILGLPGLVSTLALLDAGTDEPIKLVGSAGTLRLTRALMQGVWPGTRPMQSFSYQEQKPGVVFTTDGFTVRSFKVQHSETDSLAYVFQSDPRRHLVPELLEEMGVPRGPERARLARGQPLILPDGRAIQPDDVTTELTPGTKLVVVGDCGDTTEIVAEAMGADGLVIESTFVGRDARLARERGHLTARAAGELARDANVKQLVLTHLSGRYSPEDVLADAREVFANVSLAHDFLTFEV